MARYRIAYVLALAITVLSFIGSNSPLMLALAVMLVVAGVLAAVTTVLGAQALNVSFALDEGCPRGEEALLHINTTRMPGLLEGVTTIELSCHVITTGELYRQTVALNASVASRDGSYTVKLPTAVASRVELHAGDIRYLGLFGQFTRKVAGGFTGFYTVAPCLADVAVRLDRVPRARFTGSTYDRTRKGTDVSETFDVREYVEGDTLTSVHWKLSSKSDELIVREPAHPSNHDMLLLYTVGRDAACGSAAAREAAATACDLAATMSSCLYRMGLPHDVAFLSGGKLEQHSVEFQKGYEEMLEFMLSAPLPQTTTSMADALAVYERDHAFTKVVVVACELDRAFIDRFVRECDISYFVVSAGAVAGATEQEGCTIASIAPGSVGTTVKVLSV